jgi:hypothetical protein
MTADQLAAPPQTRPPHINPHWWYRATWRARQQAVDAHHRNQHNHDRIIAEARERAIVEELKAHVEELRLEHYRRYHPDQIIDTLDDEPMTWPQRLNELADLMALGSTPEDAALAIGKSASAIEKQARDHGRPEIARIYNRLRARSKRCVDCGDPVGKNSTRCKPCAGFMREMDRRTMRGAA